MRGEKDSINREVLKIKAYWDGRANRHPENKELYHSYFRMEEVICIYASYIRNGRVTDRATIQGFVQEAFMKLDSLEESIVGMNGDKMDSWLSRLQRCRDFLLKEAHYREKGIQMSMFTAEELRSI